MDRLKLDSLKTLLVFDDLQRANRIVSVLRSGGYKPDARHLTLPAELPDALESWQPDLVLADLAATCVPAKTLFLHLRQSGRDLEALLTVDEWDAVAVLRGLRFGAAAVLPREEDQLLLEAVGHSMMHLDTRRELRQWQRRYRQAEERCNALLDDAQYAIAIVQDGAYVRANEHYARLLSYSIETLLGLPVLDTVQSPDDSFRQLLKPETIAGMYKAFELDLIFKNSEGREYPSHLRVTPVYHGGDAALEFRIDTSDTSTSAVDSALPTVSSGAAITPQQVIEHLSTAIRRSVHRGSDSAQLYIEITRFEELRSELGIAATEQLLKQLAELIAAQLPQQFIGRLREDTFIVVVNDVSREAALDIAGELSNDIARHIFTLARQTRQLAVNIGVSLIGEVISSAEASLELGLQAVRDAGQEGGGVYFRETPTTLIAADNGERADTVPLGRLLLKRRGFRILFQPVASLHGERAHYYDVLLGLKPHVLADETPTSLIDDLFKTELAAELDRFVIVEALHALESKLKQQPSLSLMIRTSEASWFDPDFSNWLEEQLRHSTLAPASLLFQLSESSAARHFHQAEKLSSTLKQLGCGVVLSDFGLALNPFDIAARLAPTLIKLDRTLTLKAAGSLKEQEALTLRVDQLRKARYRVIAPFVESAAILPTLWTAGIDFIQGLYLQPPMPNMSYEFDEQ